jgi:hypothetical protein
VLYPYTPYYWGVFSGCTNLASVTFAAGSQLASIGSYAFYGCTSLASVTFGAGSQLASIGNNAFYGCSSLAGIAIPAGVTSIGLYAFRDCINIASITIPAGVTSIGGGAFYDWHNLQTINIEGHASQAAADAAWGSNWGGDCYATISYLGQETIERRENIEEKEHYHEDASYPGIRHLGRGAGARRLPQRCLRRPCPPMGRMGNNNRAHLHGSRQRNKLLRPQPLALPNARYAPGPQRAWLRQ